MSLKPSRIHHVRNFGTWRKQYRPDIDACPSELPRLPVWADDDEADDSSCVRPGESEDVASVVNTVSSTWPTDSPVMPGDSSVMPGVGTGGRDVPVKLRHFRVAAARGYLEAMYLLAQECVDPVERIHWLTLAAEQGHVAAMHDLGLASAALHERRRWLLRAARHGWVEAMAELGDVECS